MKPPTIFSIVVALTVCVLLPSSALAQGTAAASWPSAPARPVSSRDAAADEALIRRIVAGMTLSKKSVR